MSTIDETFDARGETLARLASFLGLELDAETDAAEPAVFRDLWTRSGLTATAYAAAVAKFLGLERASFEAISAAPSIADAFAPRFLREFGVYPYLDASKAPTVAIAEPIDRAFDRAAEIVLSARPRYVVASYDEIASLIAGRLGDAQAETQATGDAAANDDDVESLRDLASGAPVVRALNDLFERAVESRATDLHIEPMRDSLSVRLRVDGVLRACTAPGVNIVDDGLYSSSASSKFFC